MMSRDSGSVSVSSSRYEGGAGTVGPFKLGRVADGRVLKVLPLRWIKCSTYAVHASSSRASQQELIHYTNIQTYTPEGI